MGSSVLVAPSITQTPPQLLPSVTTRYGLETNLWLADRHPTYLACKDEWKRHERAMRGGREVECWLEPFDWEQTNGEHHNARKRMLTWLPFADRFATLLIGHMMREAPEPDWGTLGTVSRKTASALPTPAELIAFNTDGVGSDGSQWDNFWTNVARWAVATGHRYVWAHAPFEKPANRAEEIAGKRPYLQSLSPLSVINYNDVRGRKEFAIVRRWIRNPRVTKDGWEGNVAEPEYVLMTRKGCTVFNFVNPAFENGGWFVFDAKGNADPTQQGTWDATEGEIPLFTLYYERMSSDSGSVAISRSGITEMVNASIAYMNLASAADFDVWDAGTSVKALSAVDDESFNLFVAKFKQGNRFVPLKMSKDSTVPPSIEDASGSPTTSTSFDGRLRSKRNEALEFMLNEIQIAPDSSGVARAASFTDVREPRLALMAAEMETTQNAALEALERLWGAPRSPSASVEWPREFKLIDPSTTAADFFTVENLAGVHSPTAGAKILTANARGSGIVGDDDEEAKVLAEYEKALHAQADAAAQLASLAGAVNNPTGAPATPQTKPGPLSPPPLTTDIVRLTDGNQQPLALRGGKLTTNVIRGADGKIKQIVQSRGGSTRKKKKQPAPPIIQQNSGQRNAGTHN
jgi:hypothetical protein